MHAPPVLQNHNGRAADMARSCAAILQPARRPQGTCFVILTPRDRAATAKFARTRFRQALDAPSASRHVFNPARLVSTSTAHSFLPSDRLFLAYM
jgi:hypothetical protein